MSSEFNPESLAKLKSTLSKLEAAQRTDNLIIFADIHKDLMDYLRKAQRESKKSHTILFEMKLLEMKIKAANNNNTFNLNFSYSMLIEGLKKSIEYYEEKLKELNLIAPSPIITYKDHVQEHIDKSKKLFDEGDYKNSVKESISAVETLIKEYSGKHSGGLNDGLSTVIKKLEVDDLIGKALLNIYSYSSDLGGSRHANKPPEYDGTRANLSKDEALLIYQLCQPIVSYLIEKNNKKLSDAT